MANKRVTLILTEVEFNLLDEFHQDMRRTKMDIIRQAIREYIERENQRLEANRRQNRRDGGTQEEEEGAEG